MSSILPSFNGKESDSAGTPFSAKQEMLDGIDQAFSSLENSGESLKPAVSEVIERLRSDLRSIIAEKCPAATISLADLMLLEAELIAQTMKASAVPEAAKAIDHIAGELDSFIGAFRFKIDQRMMNLPLEAKQKPEYLKALQPVGMRREEFFKMVTQAGLTQVKELRNRHFLAAFANTRKGRKYGESVRKISEESSRHLVKEAGPVLTLTDCESIINTLEKKLIDMEVTYGNSSAMRAFAELRQNCYAELRRQVKEWFASHATADTAVEQEDDIRIAQTDVKKIWDGVDKKKAVRLVRKLSEKITAHHRDRWIKMEEEKNAAITAVTRTFPAQLTQREFLDLTAQVECVEVESEAWLTTIEPELADSLRAVQADDYRIVREKVLAWFEEQRKCKAVTAVETCEVAEPRMMKSYFEIIMERAYALSDSETEKQDRRVLAAFDKMPSRRRKEAQERLAVHIEFQREVVPEGFTEQEFNAFWPELLSSAKKATLDPFLAVDKKLYSDAVKMNAESNKKVENEVRKWFAEQRARTEKGNKPSTPIPHSAFLEMLGNVMREVETMFADSIHIQLDTLLTSEQDERLRATARDFSRQLTIMTASLGPLITKGEFLEFCDQLHRRKIEGFSWLKDVSPQLWDNVRSTLGLESTTLRNRGLAWYASVESDSAEFKGAEQIPWNSFHEHISKKTRPTSITKNEIRNLFAVAKKTFGVGDTIPLEWSDDAKNNIVVSEKDVKRAESVLMDGFRRLDESLPETIDDVATLERLICGRREVVDEYHRVMRPLCTPNSFRLLVENSQQTIEFFLARIRVQYALKGSGIDPIEKPTNPQCITRPELRKIIDDNRNESYVPYFSQEERLVLDAKLQAHRSDQEALFDALPPVIDDYGIIENFQQESLAIFVSFVQEIASPQHMGNLHLIIDEFLKELVKTRLEICRSFSLRNKIDLSQENRPSTMTRKALDEISRSVAKKNGSSELHARKGKKNKAISIFNKSMIQEEEDFKRLPLIITDLETIERHLSVLRHNLMGIDFPKLQKCLSSDEIEKVIFTVLRNEVDILHIIQQRYALAKMPSELNSKPTSMSRDELESMGEKFWGKKGLRIPMTPEQKVIFTEIFREYTDAQRKRFETLPPIIQNWQILAAFQEQVREHVEPELLAPLRERINEDVARMTEEDFNQRMPEFENIILQRFALPGSPPNAEAVRGISRDDIEEKFSEFLYEATLRYEEKIGKSLVVSALLKSQIPLLLLKMCPQTIRSIDELSPSLDSLRKMSAEAVKQAGEDADVVETDVLFQEACNRLMEWAKQELSTSYHRSSGIEIDPYLPEADGPLPNIVTQEWILNELRIADQRADFETGLQQHTGINETFRKILDQFVPEIIVEATDISPLVHWLTGKIEAIHNLGFPEIVPSHPAQRDVNRTHFEHAISRIADAMRRSGISGVPDGPYLPGIRSWPAHRVEGGIRAQLIVDDFIQNLKKARMEFHRKRRKKGRVVNDNTEPISERIVDAIAQKLQEFIRAHYDEKIQCQTELFGIEAFLFEAVFEGMQLMGLAGYKRGDQQYESLRQRLESIVITITQSHVKMINQEFLKSGHPEAERKPIEKKILVSIFGDIQRKFALSTETQDALYHFLQSNPSAPSIIKAHADFMKQQREIIADSPALLTRIKSNEIVTKLWHACCELDNGFSALDEPLRSTVCLAYQESVKELRDVLTKIFISGSSPSDNVEE